MESKMLLICLICFFMKSFNGYIVSWYLNRRNNKIKNMYMFAFAYSFKQNIQYWIFDIYFKINCRNVLQC